MMTLLKTTFGQFGLSFLVMSNDLVLFGFRIIHQSLDQRAMLCRSSFNSLIESLFSIMVNKDVSSANNLMLQLMLLCYN